MGCKGAYSQHISTEKTLDEWRMVKHMILKVFLLLYFQNHSFTKWSVADS